MYCPSCGNENPDDNNFCKDCGTVLPQSKGHVAATIAPPPTTNPPQSAQLGGGQQAGAGGPAAPASGAPSQNTASSIHEALSTGATFAGRYQILGQLGRGGMGIVYRAKDLELGGEELAIKVLQAQFIESPTEVERFKREIITARRITHSNVIRIHDFGVAGDEAFISMEILTGGTLSDLIAGKHIDLSQGIDIAIQIADGLAAAHDEGIIHRDLKPHNVMFDEKGRCKLLDFGIARLSAVTSHTVGFTGTPHYMSPEQAEGREVTTQSDLYSLGVLMFEIFTGTLPFQADSLVRLAVMHAQEPPPPPRTVRADIPEELEAVILKALRKDPTQRYRTAHEIVDDLRALKAGQPLPHASTDEVNASATIPPAAQRQAPAPQAPAPATLSGQPSAPAVTPPPKRGGRGGLVIAVLLGLVLLVAASAVAYQFVGPGFGSLSKATPSPTPAITTTVAATEAPTTQPTRVAQRTPTPRKTRVVQRTPTPRPTPRPTRQMTKKTPTPGRTQVTVATPVKTPIKSSTVAPTTNKTKFEFAVVNTQTKKLIPGVRLYFCGQNKNAPKGVYRGAFNIDQYYVDNGCEVQIFLGEKRLDYGENKIYPDRGDHIQKKLFVDSSKLP